MDYAKALAVCGAALVGAVAIAAAATPVHAQGPTGLTVVGHQTEFATRVVSYADLDLVSGSGRRALDGRVRTAVNDVCAQVVGPLNDSDMIACGWDAWRSAHPQIARAVLRARQIAETGSSPIAAAAITIDITP